MYLVKKLSIITVVVISISIGAQPNPAGRFTGKGGKVVSCPSGCQTIASCKYKGQLGSVPVTTCPETCISTNLCE
jgi:hypothetical protein